MIDLLSVFGQETDCLFQPPLLKVRSPWSGHMAFGRLLTYNLRPRLFVELGVYSGTSYSAVCETIKNSNFNCECFGIDNWVGDDHGGYYSDAVYQGIAQFNKLHFGSFSRLIRSDFDKVCNDFTDGTIDLLHIDGHHSYESVKSDFETWLPKVSARGVIMFHDIVERRDGFGVWKFWDEVCDRFPSFEFHHSHGLGVIAVGAEIPPFLSQLCEINSDQNKRRLRTKLEALSSMLTCQLSSELRNSEIMPQQNSSQVVIDHYSKREDSILHGMDLTLNRFLEIGPLYRPLVRKEISHVMYADHCDTATLLSKYAANPDVPKDQIVEVDIVIGDNGLLSSASSASPFDAVIASHVIEHVPDLVRWLSDIHSLLRDGGKLCLAVPDKRYTFDIARRLTCIKDIGDAHREERLRPSLDVICDAYRNSAGVTSAQVWAGDINLSLIEVGHPTSVINDAISRFNAGEYVDVHCWIFDPECFARTIEHTCQKYSIAFRPIYFHNTTHGREEFHVQLEKSLDWEKGWSLFKEAISSNATQWAVDIS